MPVFTSSCLNVNSIWLESDILKKNKEDNEIWGSELLEMLNMMEIFS